MNDTQLIDWLILNRYDVTYGGLDEGWSIWHIADEKVANDKDLRAALNKAVQHHAKRSSTKNTDGDKYLIVDLRKKFNRDKHITLWRENCSGYTHHLSAAGRYTVSDLRENPEYFSIDTHGRVRFPVKESDIPTIILVSSHEVAGDYMIPNDAKVQRVLENIKYIIE